MKLKFFPLASLIAFSVLVTSCSKLDKILVKKEGKWNIVNDHYVITAGGTVVLDTNMLNIGNFTFADDGTGTLTFAGTTITVKDWSADDENDRVTVTTTYAGVDETTIWTVLENKAKTQKWTRSETSGIQTDEETLDMERAE